MAQVQQLKSVTPSGKQAKKKGEQPSSSEGNGYHYNYAYLLDKDEDFKRWYENLRRGSPSSADEKLRRIGYVCRTYNLTTKQLACYTVKQATDFILDIVTELDKKGKSASYQKGYIKALKSWFKANDINITQKIKTRNNEESVRFADEVPPTQGELRKILNVADIKQKATIAFIAFPGLRLETVGNYLGKDGLRLKDLEDIIIDNDKKVVEFPTVPCMIKVSPALSKKGHPYFTFMPSQGCIYLKEFLELRMRQGEKLFPESPVITSLLHDVDFIRTNNISKSIKKPLMTAGYRHRPYVLRRYFEVQTMLAESEHLINPQWVTFFSGHKGTISATYRMNKGLPPDVIEKMREAYAKTAERFLVTESKRDTMSQDDTKALFNRQFLAMGGYSDQEIDNMQNLAELTSTDINRLLEEKQKKKLGLNGNSQKVIALAEVEKYINDGWEWATNLPNGNVIVRLPTRSAA